MKQQDYFSQVMDYSFFFSPGFYQVVLFFMQTETIKKVNFAVKDNRKSHSIITFKNNCKKK